MKRELIRSVSSSSRNAAEIWAYRFSAAQTATAKDADDGPGKALAIVAGMRGDEVLQTYVASQIVKQLAENENRLPSGREILVIPAANPHSFNTGTRHWGLDGTDINRMFPGYAEGETTQRIAKSIMDATAGYEWGINLTSIRHPGTYLNHIRIHKTGFEDLHAAAAFGLRYTHLHEPNPQETGSLNYNWQIFGTKGISMVGGRAFDLNASLARENIQAVLRFMSTVGLWPESIAGGHFSSTIGDEEIGRVIIEKAGIFVPAIGLDEEVEQGDLLGTVSDASNGSVLQRLFAPRAGRVFYIAQGPLVYQNMVAYRLV